MGYDAKGVDTVQSYRRPYGVVVRAVPAPESDEKLVCKVRETRLLFEDPRLGPSPCSTDSHKERTDCHVTGRLSNSGSREDLEAWLASKTDGKDIPAGARDHILRLVFDDPAIVDGVVRIEIWFDVFILGRGRSHEEEEDDVVYWYYDDDDDDDEDEDGPICEKAWHAMKCVTITGNEEEEEEVECSICLEDKTEVGSVIMTLSCGHVFHIRCISMWLFEHCYCPICWYKFPIQTYEDYPCVCNICLYNHAHDPSALPDHPPPHYKFY